ncbi:MAG: hypothetical protein B6242_12395 [Anaerolineaceae bacterium 4572_78]|nr:MAG: hypothetical protein B6242_12395 [Anaerolineaceae bacterium 4572_78]
MYNTQLQHIITEAITRINNELTESAPYMAERVGKWMTTLSGTATPEDYFLHPLAFPMLLLPWWCEQTLCTPADLDFQSDLAYSTINGYYYIRLIDDIMDGDAEIDSHLLPALNFFHTQFHGIYFRYFDAEHSFWHDFKQIWLRSAESAMQDASLTEIDYEQFQHIAAQKVCAAKIPVIAVCYQYNRSDLVEVWSNLVDLLGCWNQMTNDLFDWHKDLTHQIPSYFLSEARRQKSETETITDWVIREGFSWGCELAYDFMDKLKSFNTNLQNSDLEVYLDRYYVLFSEREADVQQGFQNMSKLLSIVGHK